MALEGKVWVFGDDVDTDVIIPARYLTTFDPCELGRHCMEDIDNTFAGKVGRGDIIVAGDNFGCGSSREHAPIAIKGAGVACVVARSFARIFYRNAINIGLPIVEIPTLRNGFAAGDLAEVDFAAGACVNKSTGKTYSFPAFPPFLARLIAAGGLINYVAEVGKDD